MTGEEGIEEGDIEEEIRRELEALSDCEVQDIEKYESEDTNLSNLENNEDEHDAAAESVEMYIRLLQSRNTKVEDELIEIQDVLKPSHQPNHIEKTHGHNEEIPKEIKEKVLTEIEEFDSNDKASDKQHDVEDSISCLEEMGLSNLKELEQKQHVKSDWLENIFNELKEEEMLRSQKDKIIREENKRKANEEYKMKVEENQMIKLKLEEEAKSKQRKLKDLEMMLEVEMKDLEKKQKQERLALQKLKDRQIQKQKLRKEMACITIQKNYRGYRVMSKHGEFLKMKREERREQSHEELEALKRREIELMKEAARKMKEEEEEERRVKEIEKERIRLEKERRELEEREKKEQEDGKVKEEEERRKREEEARRKKEEERRKKEEERRKKEEERRKKEEERRKKEEEERRKKEEEERKKKEEEERKKKEKGKKDEYEKKQIEEEKRKEEKRSEDERKKTNEMEKKTAAELERKRDDEGKVKGVREDENEVKGIDGNEKNEDNTRDVIVETSKDITGSNVLLTSPTDGCRSQQKVYVGADSVGERKTIVLQKREMNAVNNETNGTNNSREARFLEEKQLHDLVDNKEVASDKGCCKSDGGELSGMSAEMEIRRAEWLKRTVPWSSLSSEDNKPTKTRSRSRRPSSASQKLPSLSEEEIAKSLNKFSSLEQVVHVNLKDLPARNLKLMLRCPNVKSVSVQNCGLLAAESFENCRYLKELNLSDNCIQNINCENIESLEHLDLSKNQLTSVHGLDGCSNLRLLKLDGNKITRIGSCTLNNVMHLSLRNNQLIATKGLSQMKYLQTLDCSNNFLNHLEELESCPLLRIINFRGNNLQKPPILLNHVLLREIHLGENSITSLESLTNQWLPLLQHLYVDNNSLSSLTPLQGLPMLETLDIRNNLISDEDNLIPRLTGCHRLRNLYIHGNPICEDSNIRSMILRTLPGLDRLDDEDIGTDFINQPTRNKKTFQMCVKQILEQNEMLARHKTETARNIKCESNDDNQIIKQLEVQTHQFSEIQDLIIKHRLQHENFQQNEQKNLAGALATKGLRSTAYVKCPTKETEFTILCEKVEEVLVKEDIIVDRMAQGFVNNPTERNKEDSSAWNNRHHQSATRIQACYRGFRIRKRYLEATKLAHYEDVDTGEQEEFNFDEEVDLSMFDVDEAALDNSWIPTSSVERSPRNLSPPNQQSVSQQFATYPTAEEEHGCRPFPPRQAWRSPDSPLSQHNPKRVVPPIDTTVETEQVSHSGNTTERSHRTSELSSEWGFSKNATAELMLKRAKKMKYNALRKKKLNDPGKRLELFKKTDEANKVQGVQPIQKKKEKQRIDYFTGRESRPPKPSKESMPTNKQEDKAKEEMTFSWVYDQAVLHKDKGDEILQDTKGYLTESVAAKNQPGRSPIVNLPRMDPVILAGRHLSLVASPVGNPRPSPMNISDDLKHTWNQEKTHSNPDLTRTGLNKVNEKREKSNSADARITRERNNLFS